MENKNFEGLAVSAACHSCFLGAFMVYPLMDVFVYSFEEGYNFASQTYYGVGARTIIPMYCTIRIFCRH